MSFIDIVILIVGLGGLAVGYSRGLTRTLGDIVAVIVAVVAARVLGAGQQMHITILIFIAAYIAVRLIAGALHKVVHAIKLGPLNRLAGAVFVCAEYLLLLSLLMQLWLWLGQYVDLIKPADWSSDPLAQFVLQVGPRLVGKMSTMLHP